MRESVGIAARAEAALGGVSPERVQALLEHSWDILSLLDQEGRLIYNSPAAQRLHGFAPEEMAARSTFDFFHPEDAPTVAEAFQACLDQPGQPVRVEYRYACKDGSWIWMEAVAVNLLHHPAVRAIVVNSRDISERKAAQAALKAAEEQRLQLERILHQSQKMESLGSLAGGVAHEMNNVLASILGMASMHQEIQPPNTPVHHAFSIITKASIRGGDVVRRLLDFARQSFAEVAAVDLNPLIQEDLQLLERTTLGQIRFTVALEPELRPVMGDATALAHAIMNLSLNAIDAMPQGGGLTWRSRNAPGGWVELEIEDTGFGMSQEVMDKAMDPFFTTKPVGKGTGLGLSIVYSTIKAHQGTVELQSEPGRGTRVRLRLPSIPRPEAAHADPPAPPPGGATQGLDILLVDDDELILATQAPVIECLGHRVSVARSGEQALKLLQAGQRPQAVILDLNMPGLGGLATLPRIRECCPEVPVLLATGCVDEAPEALVHAFAKVRLLTKPFSMQDLKASLAQLLDGGRP